MGRLDVERKRKTAWPAVIGVAILVLVLWAISGLLAEDPQEEPQVTVATVEDTFPPAAIPAPPHADPELTGTDAARDVAEIAPLGEEDVGQPVRLEGEVVATGNSAFWLLAGGEVLRVESPRRVRRGDTLAVAGTLRPADPAKTDRIADVLSRHPGAADWSVVRAVKLVESSGGGEGEVGAPRPEA